MSPKRPIRPRPPRSKSDPAPKRKSPPDPPGDDPIAFPLTLRNLRLGIAGRLGRPWRQEDVAKKAKINAASLSNIERGAQPASQFMLFKLSEFYGVDIELVRRAYAGSRAKLDRKPKS